MTSLPRQARDKHKENSKERYFTQHNGWERVTLRHTLSMATGMGVGPEEVQPNHMSDDEPRGRTTDPEVADDYENWMLMESSV